MQNPDGELGISYRELAHVAAARADRAEGEGRSAAVREKLLRAWAEQRRRAAPVVDRVAEMERRLRRVKGSAERPPGRATRVAGLPAAAQG